MTFGLEVINVSQAYGSKFAKIYNMMWGGFSEKIAPVLLEFYQNKSNVQNDYILDLCCGTGQLAKFFLEEGYHVIGLDLSESMLNYARINTEKYINEGRASFINADASNFTLDEKVGLVISIYDSLNHLEDIQALKGCFNSVYKVLINEGYFIFDLNTRLGLKNGWNSISFMDKGDIVILNRGIYDEENSKAIIKISGFIENENGLYERFDEVIYNTVYELEEVKEILKETGWKEVYFAKSTNLNKAINKPEEENRVFIVAKK